MSSPYSAPFIAIEGLEGASKSTSLNTLSRVVEQAFPISTVREPGGTPIAEQLRTMLKQVHPHESLSGMSEILLMSTARVQVFDNVIIPALSRSAVLSDRSWLSTFAYQVFGRQAITVAHFAALYQLIMSHYRPYDLIIYLDIPPQVGLQRAKQRGELDRFELEHLDFFNRAREGYLSALTCLPQAVKIDANRTIDEVQHDVARVTQDFIAGWQGPVASHPDFSTLTASADDLA